MGYRDFWDEWMAHKSYNPIIPKIPISQSRLLTQVHEMLTRRNDLCTHKQSTNEKFS